MFVSGVGGTGKSFLIEAIKALITDIWPTDDLTFAVAAPTGLLLSTLVVLPLTVSSNCQLSMRVKQLAIGLCQNLLKS